MRSCLVLYSFFSICVHLSAAFQFCSRNLHSRMEQQMWTKKERGRIDKLIFLKNLFISLMGNLFRNTNIYVLTNIPILPYFLRYENSSGKSCNDHCVGKTFTLLSYPSSYHLWPSFIHVSWILIVLKICIIHSFIPWKFTGPQLCTRHCLRCCG